MAALCVAIALSCRSRTLLAIGVLILCFGSQLWIVNLLFGGEFYPTSIFTHVGSLSLGIVGLRQLGGVRDDWWKALVFAWVLISPHGC